ncbi:MAG: hypothetical protein WC455_28605 [Dehalococcoidia bacterium]
MTDIPIWESNGIRGRGEKAPVIAGTRSGTAVVLGSARCIWDDLSRIDFDKVEVIAVNDMIMHYKGELHHAVSLHPEEPPLWRQLRWTNGCHAGGHIYTHSHRLPENNDHLPPYEFKTRHALDFLWVLEGGRSGSSGLFACMVGLAMGYERIILAGIPIDGTGHFFDPPGKVVNQFLGMNITLEWDNANRKYFKGRVKSLSGRTKEWLGEPPTEWGLIE